MFAAKHSASVLLAKNTLRQSNLIAKTLPLAGVVNMNTMRAFTTGTISSGASKLTRALEKELKYENENYTQLEDIETFLNESGFAFSEEDTGMSMVLKKQVGDKTIEIAFEARYCHLYL